MSLHSRPLFNFFHARSIKVKSRCEGGKTVISYHVSFCSISYRKNVLSGVPCFFVVRCGYTLRRVCLRQVCNYHRLQRSHNTALYWRLTGISFHQQTTDKVLMVMLYFDYSFVFRMKSSLVCLFSVWQAGFHHSYTQGTPISSQIQVTPLPFITHSVLAPGMTQRPKSVGVSLVLWTLWHALNLSFWSFDVRFGVCVVIVGFDRYRIYDHSMFVCDKSSPFILYLDCVHPPTN